MTKGFRSPLVLLVAVALLFVVGEGDGKIIHERHAADPEHQLDLQYRQEQMQEHHESEPRLRNRRLSPRVSGLRPDSRFGGVSKASLQGGAEFDSSDTYQSRALSYVKNGRMLTEDSPDFLQYYALACLFYSTNAVHNKHTIFNLGADAVLDGWTLSDGWLSTEQDKCSWHGITCDDSELVLAIQLPSNNLTGIFPPEIEHLGTSLEIIDIYNNEFVTTEGDAGNAWMGKLPKLRNLFFRTTSFEYNGIPTFWSGVETLEQIDCSNTFFSGGPIRRNAFRNLPNLWYLDIGGNIYTSGIPDTLLQLPSLTNFYAPEAMYIGYELDLRFLTQMPVIAEAWFDFTAIPTGLPTELGLVSTLTSLSLIYCEMGGTLPTELAGVVGLKDVFLFQNELMGMIPPIYGNLISLQNFYVEGNQLVGQVPESICQIRAPVGPLVGLGTDCQPGGPIDCGMSGCCTCCGADECGDADFL